MRLNELQDLITRVRISDTIEIVQCFIKYYRAKNPQTESFAPQEFLSYLKSNQLVHYVEIKGEITDQHLVTIIKKGITLSNETKQALAPKLDSGIAYTGVTSLQVAAKQNNLPWIEKLIDEGADVNLQYADAGVTALTEACHQASKSKQTLLAYKDTIQFLLTVNADINQPDAWGSNILDMAIRDGQADMVKILLYFGAIITDKMLSKAKENALIPFTSGWRISKLLSEAKKCSYKEYVIENEIYGALLSFPKDIVKVIADYHLPKTECHYYKKKKNAELEIFPEEKTIRKLGYL